MICPRCGWEGDLAPVTVGRGTSQIVDLEPMCLICRHEARREFREVTK